MLIFKTPAHIMKGYSLRKHESLFADHLLEHRKQNTLEEKSLLPICVNSGEF